MIFIVKVAFDMEILKLATLYGENSSSDHTRIWSRNRVEITVKAAYNMETVKYLNLPKYMVGTLVQTTHKSATKIGSKLP